MNGFTCVCLAIVAIACVAQDVDHERLLPLTQFRREHRRTIDGRLCAAAFVQDKRAFSGCTKTKTPSGDSGREWCYVDAQVATGHTDSANPWNYCVSVADYGAARASAGELLRTKLGEVRAWIGKLQKAQRAGEESLTMYRRKCD
eukprot:TRINITY_DN2165_c0_g1_i1.p1 TRINITY_DN2165_c0_g1~~TRINITY_DN2165_c0_g1_i1.p1  ORF type:complete len:162 (-),score=19.24 TRINITY_DN2165_c0_g1_i1:88-522(-)